MINYRAEQERRAAEHFRLRPSNAARCPLVVTGSHCRLGRGERCVCTEHRRVLDHARVWLDKDGRRVLTAEPYDLDGAELVDFIDAMTGLGLRVSISGRYLWHETTVLLMVTKP